MRTTKEVFVKILGSAIIIAIFAILAICAKEYTGTQPQVITIRILTDEDIVKYKLNLHTIANEQCNSDWNKISYSSNDYYANIVCGDKTEIDLDFESVMLYIPVDKKK